MLSDVLVVVEPRGHTARELARLQADRLRTELEIRSALEQTGRQRVPAAQSALSTSREREVTGTHVRNPAEAQTGR